MTQAANSLSLRRCIRIAAVTARKAFRHALGKPASRGYPTRCSILEENLPRRAP